MRWVTYRAGSHEARVGLVVGESVHGLEPGLTLLELLGDDGERLAHAAERARVDASEVHPVPDVQLLAPVPHPPTVRDFYAFEQHVRVARERRGLGMDPDWYQIPVFYFSNPYAVVGPDVSIPAAPGSEAMDFELEVAAIIGRAGHDLTPDDAEQHIAGFCVMNDWSARDIQRREMQLSMGPVKGKDFATSLGPALVTPDELESARHGKAYDLAMVARVNGREYSRATLADIYWSFGEMVAYASRGTWVRPGDVVGSGTCGTGCILEMSLVHGEAAYPWLQPGDEVELEVERLGVLRNRLVAGEVVRPLR
jgi:fumarylacetoacetate (FAA) hydrolase